MLSRRLAVSIVAGLAVASCQPERCHNGRLDPGELCDWADGASSIGSIYGYGGSCRDDCTSLTYHGRLARIIDEAVVVLVRDNSPSMCSGYAPAAELSAALINELANRPVRFAATTTDGQVNLWAAAKTTWPVCAPPLSPPKGCMSASGPKDAGIFSSFSWVGTCCVSGEDFVWLAGCMADVGAEGEPIEWPLGTLLEYFTARLFPAETWGTRGSILLPGAAPPIIAVILTDEDDCTLCSGGVCGPGSTTSSADCASLAMAATLVPVSELTAELEALTDGPVRVVVAAGPPSTVVTPDPMDPERIAPSCTAPDGRRAAPANRLAEWVAEKGDDGTFLSWCEVTAESLADAVATYLPRPHFETSVPEEALPTLRVYLDPLEDQPCPPTASATAEGWCALQQSDDVSTGYVLRPVGSNEYALEVAYPGPWEPGDPSRWDLICDWVGTEPTLLGVAGD